MKAEPLKETFDKSFIKKEVLEELHLTKNQGFGFGTLEGAIDLTIEKRDKQFASAVEWLKEQIKTPYNKVDCKETDLFELIDQAFVGVVNKVKK